MRETLPRLWLPFPLPSADTRKYQVVMYVYADDSTKGDFVCIAAYLGSGLQMNALHEEWGSLLLKYELPRLHASDFMTGQPEYSIVIKDLDERRRVITEFCEIPKRHAAYAIAISTNVRDFKAAREHVKGPKGPSGFLFYRMLARIYAKLDEMEAIEPVGFIFDNSEAESMRFYNIWYKAKKYRKFARDRLASITFGDDRMIAPVQAADVLAYGVWQEYPNGSSIGVNGPFRELFSPCGSRLNPFEWEHWDSEMLAENFDVIGDYGTID